VVVDTPVGVFTGLLGDPTSPPAVGASVTVSIRPECWTLSERMPERNGVRGRIGGSTYLGEIAQYDFRVGETLLKVYELNPRHLGQASTDLYASVAPEDVVILTA
jgi:iron(III) transport system ATP-binding protein